MKERLKDKKIFDVNETLSKYRYKDKLYNSKCLELNCRPLEDLLFNTYVYTARSLKTMQNMIKDSDLNKIFILGTVVTNHEIKQKYQWLKENYPSIKGENISFINPVMMKPDVIVECSKYFPVPLERNIYIAHQLDVLRKIEELGIQVYHPSSLTE